jgi:hypothetical protein
MTESSEALLHQIAIYKLMFRGLRQAIQLETLATELLRWSVARYNIDMTVWIGSRAFES